MKQRREKSLTTKAFVIYKVSVVIFIALVGLIYSFQVFFLMKDSNLGLAFAVVYGLAVFGFGFYHTKKELKIIKEISYDDQNLYVHEKGYEIQIPFHQVKDIEILSVGGQYKFHLYHNDQFGKEVVCKPSMWYPLNYKRIDKELNRIRGMVRKAHREYKEQIGNDKSLASFN